MAERAKKGKSMQYKWLLCSIPMVSVLTGCNTISSAWESVHDEDGHTPVVLAPTKKLRFAPADTKVDPNFVSVATSEEVKAKERLAQEKEVKRLAQTSQRTLSKKERVTDHAIAQYEVVIYDQDTTQTKYPISDFYGSWRQVYPQPIAGATGWIFEKDGKARTWGRGEMNLEGWSLEGSILKIRGQVAGMSFGIPFIEEFRVKHLEKDTLTITQGARRMRFVREK